MRDRQLFQIIALTSVALPFLAGLARPARLDQPKLWIMAWLALNLLTDFIASTFAAHGLYNHPIYFWAAPCQSATLLMAMAHWQRHPVAALTLRTLSIPFGLAWVALAATYGNLYGPTPVADTLNNLLVVAAALYTMVSHAGDRASPPAQPWFWICLALALQHGASGILHVLVGLLAPGNRDLLIRAYGVYHVVAIGSFFVVAIGLLCPVASRDPVRGDRVSKKS